MFRAKLEENLKAIFRIPKVTYSAPSSFEQDTLFVQIDSCRANPGKGFASAIVQGTLTVYSQVDRMPYGFFAKQIGKAENKFKKDLNFFDMDQDVTSSEARMQNIREASCGFIFLFKEQYDMPKGDMTGVDLTQISIIESGDGSVVDSGSGAGFGAETE